MKSAPLIPALKNYASLASLFSSPVLSSLLGNKAEVSTTQIVRKSRLLTELYEEEVAIKDLFSIAYEILRRNYRSEYVYKNSLVKTILQDRHVLRESFLVPEFNVGYSKADLTIFNGTSTVYEIKSDLDNTAKLQKQLTSYLEVFDQVNLVTHENLFKRVIRDVDNRVGVLILDSSCKIHTYRAAISNKAYTIPLSIFGCMRRKEYLWVLKEAFNWSPNLPPAHTVKACMNIFSELPARTAHDYFVNAIVNNRKLTSTQIDLINRSPAALKMFTISRVFSQFECSMIDKALKTTTIV